MENAVYPMIAEMFTSKDPRTHDLAPSILQEEVGYVASSKNYYW